MADKVDVAIVGAGVVGLACARKMAQLGLEVIILDREATFGSGVSSRNSEVIHAGIYYPVGSLKARLCVEGRRLLYRYCAERGVSYRKCGKLIVATNQNQDAELHRLLRRAQDNGVEEMELLRFEEAQKLEPDLACTSALWSPETGIIDSHGLMLALLGDAEERGAVMVTHANVVSGQCSDTSISLDVAALEVTQLHARYVVNASSLDAWSVASSLNGYPEALLPACFFAKGSYFSLAVRSPFSRLVYPIPEPGGLGVHLTVDLGGQAKFGPDVEWVDEPQYDVDADRAKGFYTAIRKYWPALQDGQLQPAYAGVRPKIHGPESSSADFLVQGPSDHGIGGLVNLFGIESPGLTSCIAIADLVCKKLGIH